MAEGWKAVKDTKVAAAWGSVLGMVRTEVVVDDLSGREMTDFYLPLVGLRPELKVSLERPFIEKRSIWDCWKSGELARVDPWHPVVCGMRAEHNYERLLDMQKQGRRMRLAGVDGAYATLYTEGEEAPSMKGAAEMVETGDLSLAAALGTLGIPVVDMRLGGDGKMVYKLPRYGHVLRVWPGGEARRWDASVIMRRASSVPEVMAKAAAEGREVGPLDLALELGEPLHPLVSAYNCRCTCIRLKKHLGTAKRLVLIRQPGSARAAFVTEEATGRVMGRVREHFRI
jgi:hypothetical protein